MEDPVDGTFPRILGYGAHAPVLHADLQIPQLRLGTLFEFSDLLQQRCLCLGALVASASATIAFVVTAGISALGVCAQLLPGCLKFL